MRLIEEAFAIHKKRFFMCQDGIQHIDSDSRDNVRLKAIGILSKLPARPRGNLTKPEKEALQELRKDSTITILPADKGNSTVILNRKSYEDKIKKPAEQP